MRGKPETDCSEACIQYSNVCFFFEVCQASSRLEVFSTLGWTVTHVYGPIAGLINPGE